MTKAKFEQAEKTISAGGKTEAANEVHSNILLKLQELEDQLSELEKDMEAKKSS